MDVENARERLESQGWIPARSEYFHHLPPPAQDTWLGADDAPTAADAHDGWKLRLLGDTQEAQVQTQWLDASDPTARKTLFEGTRAPGDTHADRFVWVHRTLCRTGLRLRVDGAGSTEPVQIALDRKAQAAVEAPTLVVEVTPGTNCVLVETHETGAEPTTQNLQLHTVLGEGATLRHLRVVLPGADHQIAHQIHAKLARGARYLQALVAQGCRYHLQRTEADLDAEDSHIRTGAALFVTGTGSTLDQQVDVQHSGVDTDSDVEALMLGSGRARGVLNAMCRIAKGARDTRAMQRLSGIPTGSGQPKLILRPHMEICHDQVEAEHGATWGALPEDALFYARQRGLDEQTARALIIRGKMTALLAAVLDDDAELLSTLGMDLQLERAVATHLAAGGSAK